MKNICYIISAGDCSGINFIKKKNDYVIAADAGYQYAVEHGVEVDMVLGDFDSLGYVPKMDNVVVHKPEKDDTDTFLAIQAGEKLGYSEFVIYGALGGQRFAHSIANVQTLIYLAKKGKKATIIDDKIAITALCDGSITLPKKDGGYFSIFSFVEKAEGVSIVNAKYSVENIEITNSNPIGVSNEFIGKKPEITVRKGDLVIIWQL